MKGELSSSSSGVTGGVSKNVGGCGKKGHGQRQAQDSERPVRREGKRGKTADGDGDMDSSQAWKYLAVLVSHGGRADPDLPEETRRGGGAGRLAGISGVGLAECSRCLQLQIENGEYQTVSTKERYLATP